MIAKTAHLRPLNYPLLIGIILAFLMLLHRNWL